MLITKLLAEVTILIAPIWFTSLWQTCWWDLWGNYIKETKTINICTNANIEQRKSILLHELWHHYWYNHLTEKQRIDFTELSKKCKNDICFVSDRAKVNVLEDFAETFRANLQKETWLSEFERKLFKKESILYYKKINLWKIN